IEALHPEKILALGNPLFDFGRFYKAFHHQQWHKISISCRECVQWQKQHVKIDGLVTDEWIKEQEEFHGPKSDYVSIHVDGEFPEQSESSIISRAWVERARKGLDANNAPLPVESQEDSVRILACDVATKHGTNATVIAYRYGHTFLEMAGYFRIPITQTRDKLLFRFNRYTYSDVLPKIVLDSDGIGEGLGDMLDSESVPNIQFHGGTNQAAMDQGKFHNLRTQFYLLVAKKFERGLYNLSKLDEKSYEILKNQLCSIRAKHPDNLGRLQLETKEEMMARNIESPDYSDSFMMSEYAYFVSNMADVQPFSYR
ncbi:MAG: hypothetical protein KKE30_01745, partial [Gammaproteobacteria bacterium]|nr:hypothetical protein [Gammaproteobacteria bacterium]